MRFKSSIKNISTFTKLTASLSSLGKVAWVRLDNDQVRFTIIPEQGTQVWAVLSIDTIFSNYRIQSASPNNTINLELPLPPLHRALRSALTSSASSASLRLTKSPDDKDLPILSLNITTHTPHPYHPSVSTSAITSYPLPSTSAGAPSPSPQPPPLHLDRETIITQNVPVRVLSAANVSNIHEPRCREPDVHILLPSLLQLKSISERFTKLATTTTPARNSGFTNPLNPTSTTSPKLQLSANMHGRLKLSITTDALDISSVWEGLSNPELDPTQVEGGLDGIRTHPSTRMKEDGGWASVLIDGRDWGRVLSVGRLGGRVIACFVDGHALILYVYLDTDGDIAPGGESDTESVLTYYISSYAS